MIHPNIQHKPEKSHDSDATECDCKQDNANRRPHRAADVFLVSVVVNILSGDSRSFLSHFHFGRMVEAESVSWGRGGGGGLNADNKDTEADI